MLTAGPKDKLNTLLAQIQKAKEIMLPFKNEDIQRELEFLCEDLGMNIECLCIFILQAEEKIIKALNQA